MPLIARRRIVASAVALVAALALVGSTAATTPLASADTPTSTAAAAASAPQGTVEAASTASKLKCEKAARKKAPKNKVKKYWICVGKHVRYLKKQRFSPAVAGKFYSQKDDPDSWMGFDAPRDARNAGKVVAGEEPPIGAKDDEDWCETTPQCVRVLSDYVAETKAHVYFGRGKELWGAFDVTYRQSFQGGASTYRLTLEWKKGTAVDSDFWVAQVYWNVPGPINVLVGQANALPPTISQYAKIAWAPSSNSYETSRPLTNHTGKHYDQMYGAFFAHGQRFAMNSAQYLHLPDFHCPDHICQYYE